MLAQQWNYIYHVETDLVIDTADLNINYFSQDSALILAQLEGRNLVRQLQERSYIAANLDSIVFDSSRIHLYIYQGRRLVFGKINWNGIDEQWLDHPVLRKMDLSGEALANNQVALVMQTLLNQTEDFGFPLAKINFTNQAIRNDSLFGDVILDRGPFIRFGGIIQDTADIISTPFLERYLDIKPEQRFEMSKINSIERQISQLPYIRLYGTPEIKILDNKATVNLKFKENPASRFDFLIGILPTAGDERPFTISGELTADFKNKFGVGESIFFNIQQLKPETQRIDFKATYPYLLNLPFGIHGSFSLYKNGVESRDLSGELGIQYRSGKNLESRFFVNYQSSRLIQIDSSVIIASGKLPSSLDVRSNNIGVRLTNDQRDYRFNPRKGLRAEISLLAGIRSTLANQAIQELSSESVDFSMAYDSLDFSLFQTTVVTDIEYFIPIRKLSTIKIANSSGLKWNQQEVYFNEYYRIGGTNYLRGFDEESIRAQYYSVFTAEYRFLLGLNSYFSSFIDYGIVYNAFREVQKLDTPFGFGVGLSFQTTAGIFGIDVALGRELGNSIDFRNAKTHFGFISLF